MVNAYVVQDLSYAKAALVHRPHAIVILLGVGFLHLLETVWAALKVGSESAEHTPGTAHAGGVKFKFLFALWVFFQAQPGGPVRALFPVISAMDFSIYGGIPLSFFMRIVQSLLGGK
ncbi:hypothetical protein [Flintibacter muris]|uniref:hypothetical protein n=1 Tax=Flintibacter muris TaxID=2941327 RepID=UPI0030B9BFDF